MAYGLSNGHVTADVTWPPKVLWGSTVGSPSDSLASCFVYIRSLDRQNLCNLGLAIYKETSASDGLRAHPYRGFVLGPMGTDFRPPDFLQVRPPDCFISPDLGLLE